MPAREFAQSVHELFAAIARFVLERFALQDVEHGMAGGDRQSTLRKTM